MSELKETLTQEERREIFKDLCARIYYGVRVVVIRNGEKFVGSLYLVTRDEKFNIRKQDGVVFENNIDIYDENFVFYPMLFKPSYYADNELDIHPFNFKEIHDFSMCHYVDVNDLIPKGLAVDLEHYKGKE